MGNVKDMDFVDFLNCILTIKESVEVKELNELKALFEKCKTIIEEGNNRRETSPTKHDIAWRGFLKDCEASSTSSSSNTRREPEGLSDRQLHHWRMKNDSDYFHDYDYKNSHQ